MPAHKYLREEGGGALSTQHPPISSPNIYIYTYRFKRYLLALGGIRVAGVHHRDQAVDALGRAERRGQIGGGAARGRVLALLGVAW
jgi:hypothetical protein